MGKLAELTGLRRTVCLKRYILRFRAVESRPVWSRLPQPFGEAPFHLGLAKQAAFAHVLFAQRNALQHGQPPLHCFIGTSLDQVGLGLAAMRQQKRRRILAEAWEQLGGSAPGFDEKCVNLGLKRSAAMRRVA